MISAETSKLITSQKVLLGASVGVPQSEQGSMSVYQYNIQFQKLARFAKQDVPDEKSMIYQFRGGLREDLQLALVLLEPTKFDQFYNMALNQEAA